MPSEHNQGTLEQVFIRQLEVGKSLVVDLVL